MLSVALALMILSLLLAFLAAVDRVEGSSESRVVVRSAIALTFPLPEAYWRRLETLDHVVAVTPLSWFGGTYKDSSPANFFPRFGADPATLFSVFPEYQIEPAERAAFAGERTAFIAGAALAERYGWQLGDTIALLGDLYPFDVELTLRGIYRQPSAPSAERQIYFHRRYLEEAGGNPGEADTFWLAIDEPAHVAAVITAAEELFRNSDSQVRAETEEAFALSFTEMVGNFRLLVAAIGAAIVIAILLITANTMAMAARERLREVAVLRTLGFRRHQVRALVWLEALIVGVGGAALGLLLAGLAMSATRAVLRDAMPFFSALEPNLGNIGLALLIGSAIGLISGAVPAWNAGRLRIVEGLRRVD